MTSATIGYFCMCNVIVHWRLAYVWAQKGVQKRWFMYQVLNDKLLTEAILCGIRQRIIVTLRQDIREKRPSWPADFEVE